MCCIVENLENYVYILKYDAVLYLGIRSVSLKWGAGSEYEYEPCRLSKCVGLLFVECLQAVRGLPETMRRVPFPRG